MSTDNLTADVFAKILPAGRDRALMRAALRLLAHGTPVTVTELAAAAGVPDLDPAQTPIGADVEYDEAGRIVGWGLTLNPTPHRFSVGGHQLYTWCAPDTLIFPAVIGAPACIESDCPITGTTVRLTIDPVTGVSDLEPATAMVAFVDPDRIQPGHLRATCCNPQMFLATSDAAHHWQAKFPGMTVLPVTDAYHQLARPSPTRSPTRPRPPEPAPAARSRRRRSGPALRVRTGCPARAAAGTRWGRAGRVRRRCRPRWRRRS